MNVYDIHNLTKCYPGQTSLANDKISLQIQAGEIFGLLGDNGAGKSTLVKQMVNLLASTSGEIRLFGKPVASEPFHVPMSVGYMPQDNNAMNNLTVGEALYFTAHLRGLSRHDARRQRDWLLELWQIGSLRHQYSPRLSGGQKRLLRLAVAMAGSAPILVLDEPTNDLDPQRRKLVWDVLRDENRNRGATIIFITHDAIEAEKIIQRVGIMHAGKLVALGKPGELKQQVDQQLRLELFFTPDQPPVLPAGLTPHALDAGRWLVYLERRQAGAVIRQLDLAQIHDFRLYSATLEDLYLHYANDIPSSPIYARSDS
ncbi:MAG: ABC transporter ATP-binding protein [Chloroflexi bacterium]|nr:MAG: ABC transporter ATP-binding protein [Chloroflexota bacterium]